MRAINHIDITSHRHKNITNRRSLDSLQPGDRDILVNTVNAAAPKQRGEVRKLNDELAGNLKKAGLEFITVNPEQFRDKLRASPFYTEWKTRFGDEAWSTLEEYAGKLG